MSGRRVLVVFLLLGLLVEIPLAYFVLLRDSDTTSEVVVPTNARPQGTLRGASAPLPLHPVAAGFEPDNRKVVDCSEQTCFEQAYGNIAFRSGPKRALALIDKRYAGGADPNCHRIVHIVGAASLARNKGNVARTFTEGSSICWSGYYHGVLERAFLKVESFTADALGAKARGLCDDRQVRASSWLAYQCLHGLGHGLMITTGYQLPLTLEVCKRLGTPWDRTSCKGGVFMENILTSYGGQSPYVRDNDPLYPCNWVAVEDKFECYQQATTRIIRVVGVDWPKIANVCAGAEKRWVAACFGSFGQNASVLASRRPAPIIETCAVARPFGGEAQCVRYAAMDIAGTYSGGKEAAVLCGRASVGLRPPCYHAIGLMLRHLRSTPRERRAECNSLSGVRALAARCIAGSEKRSSIPGLAR